MVQLMSPKTISRGISICGRREYGATHVSESSVTMETKLVEHVGFTMLSSSLLDPLKLAPSLGYGPLGPSPLFYSGRPHRAR
jgi:hypothetical protein